MLLTVALAMVIGIMAIVPAVFAGSPDTLTATQATTSKTSSFSTDSLTLTASMNAGDLIYVGSECTPNGNTVGTQAYTGTPTDNKGNAYSSAGTTTYGSGYWTRLSASESSITITWTANSGTMASNEVCGMFGLWANVPPAGVIQSIATTTCSSPCTGGMNYGFTVQPITGPTVLFRAQGAVGGQGNSGGRCSASGGTLDSKWSTSGSAYYYYSKSGFSSALTFSDSVSFSTVGPSGCYVALNWLEISVSNSGIFGNQACTGACSATLGSGTYLANDRVYFYYGQNGQDVSETFYNISSYVDKVSVNTATADLYLAVYVGTTVSPNAANPLVLALSSSVALANLTTNTRLNWPANVGVCASCYYAIAVFATSTAHGTGSSGSGIELASTAVVLTMYYFDPGGSSLPTSLYPNTSTTPLVYLVGYAQFAVLTQTVATTTMTQTITSYYSNCSTDPNACSQTFLENIGSYLPLIFLALVLGVLFDVPGFLFGLILGVIIEIGMGVMPLWVLVFVGLGLFMFIWKGSSIPRIHR
jgi:hypothetical protein